MLVVFLTVVLAAWPLVVARFTQRDPGAPWLRLALFPGLGLAYLLLFVLAELRNPLLAGLGVPFGELSEFGQGKSLGNVLEIPFAFLASAWARIAFDRRRQGGADRNYLARFMLVCYGSSWAFYFLMPVLPE